MNSISITTSQNIDVEYELASLGDRIIARIIDNVILIAYIILIFVIIGFSNFESFVGNYAWLVIFLFLPVLFYDIASEMIFNGQSAGKKVMAIKVISLSGEQPSFSQYLNRWFFRLVDFTISWSLLAVIMVAATDKKQRLGDLVAGTVLIKTKTRTQLQSTLYQQVDVAYQVSYPEVINLKDSDMQLVKEVILTVYKTGNTMLALQAQQKIEQTLNIMSRQQEPLQFLQVVLSDYNHITSQL